MQDILQGLWNNIPIIAARYGKEGTDSGLGGANSRFCIRRLKFGKILLANHYNNTGRNNLTAMIFDDCGFKMLTGIMVDEYDIFSFLGGKWAAQGKKQHLQTFIRTD